MNKEIWLGSLHYGSLISFKTSYQIIKYLKERGYIINIDACNLYASGMAIKEVGKLCKEFKDLKVSVKYGLEKDINPKGNWAVKISKGGRADLQKTLTNYLEYIPERNLNTFQIHAFNSEKIEIWIDTVKNFDFFKRYGCSNMNTKELTKLIEIAKNNLIKISFSQIHANLMERRIIEEYKKSKIIDNILVNRSLARGFISNRYAKGILLKDSRIIGSKRVANSLPENIKKFLPEVMELTDIYNCSLSFLGYLWLLNQSEDNFEVKPVISPRTLEDLLDYLKAESISKNLSNDLLKKIEVILYPHKSLIYKYPLFDLEK